MVKEKSACLVIVFTYLCVVKNHKSMNFKQMLNFVFKNTSTNQELIACGMDREEAILKISSMFNINMDEYVLSEQRNCVFNTKNIFEGDDENLYLQEEDGSFSLFV